MNDEALLKHLRRIRRTMLARGILGNQEVDRVRIGEEGFTAQLIDFTLKWMMTFPRAGDRKKRRK